jgi:flagellar hook protein FlgE
MGLGSVMHTALSGLTAASTSIDVISNNLANCRTPGFKASRVRFATQPYRTYSLGSGPTSASGGINPLQIGRGVSVVGIVPDFSQGRLESDDRPALLALQGEGFFILESHDGGQEYTRDGNLTLNTAGELVSASGQRVLGYSVDGEGNLNESDLSPLQIRLGSRVPSAGGTSAMLTDYEITPGGHVMGLYDDGLPRTLGQLLVARFQNPSGLSQQRDNVFQATSASGMPTVSTPGDSGVAEIVPGATEQSNVEIGRELIELLAAKNQFLANLILIHTAGDMLEELRYLSR